MRIIFSIIIVIAVSSCKNKEENLVSEVKYDLTSKLDSIGNAFIAKGNTVGLSFAIAHGDSIVYAKGFGYANKDSKTMASDSTIYALASVSKFITGVTTMRLVEANKLSLNDKVVDFFDDFPNQEYMDEITVEHLLRHQSGLVDHEDWMDSIYISERRIYTQKELHQFLDKPLFFKPGTNYSYSNSGYSVLSNILEKVSGKSYHDLIQEEIAEPLGSNTIGMWPELWSHQNASMSYELNDKTVDTSFHMMSQGMKGDGGLSASATDLVKLVQGLNDATLISEATFERIKQPSTINGITVNYGMGMRMGPYADEWAWGHTGGYKGTGWAAVTHLPESGYTFAALMNTNYSSEDIVELRHAVMPILLGIDKPDLTQNSIENIEQYVGEYHAFNRWGNEKPNRREASNVEGKLIWDNPDSKAEGEQIFQIGDHDFTFESYPFDVYRFHLIDGEVVAVSEHYDGFFMALRMKVK